MGSPKHGTSGSSQEGLALVPQVGQNAASNLLCADATKTQSFSRGGPGDTEGKTGMGIQHSSIRACPPWPHPTCVRGSHHQHCRPGPGSDWGAPGFTDDASQGTATSTYSSTTQLGSPGTTGACSPEHSGQCTHDRSVTTSYWTSAKGADRDSAPHVIGTCQISTTRPTAAARLTGNHCVDTQSFFVSASTRIATHIPIKVKEKIWANQFTKFHEFLSPNPWAP